MKRMVVCFYLALFLGSSARAYEITVDGNAADWLLAPPPQDNLGRIARDLQGRGEYIWRDAAGDQRTDFSGHENADIRQVRMTAGQNQLFILIELGNITTPAGDGAPQIQIAFDFDGVTANGERWLGAFCDTQVSEAAAWEYLLVTRFGSSHSPAVYNTAWSDVSQGAVQAVISGNFIEVGIPVSIFSAATARPVRFTVVSLLADQKDTAWDIDGVSDVLDALTNYGAPASVNNTWAEVQDGVVDYHFEVWFHIDPESNPSPPLVINEIVPDAANEPQEEWFEIFNRTGQDNFPLAGFKVGDEETAGSTEGMAAFPADTHIGLDNVVVVANRASSFTAIWGFDPDFELNDSNAVINLLPYNPWATGSVNLANVSDELLLLDPFDTVIDVFCWGTSTCWPGVTPASRPAEGHSLERPQHQSDTDDCNHDSLERTTPTPGAVSWIKDLGEACSAGIECSSGFCADTVCCESACNGVCDGQCGNDGRCQPLDCPTPQNACQLESCNLATGCFAALGVPCDDADACTNGESCDGLGHCQGGTQVVCPPPQNSCQLATCNSLTGCIAADGSPCNDNNLCTFDDACLNGQCQGQPKDCSDGNVCTDDSCNPANGFCLHSNNTAPCNDADLCTYNDICSGGSCIGQSYQCNDNNICTDDACLGDGTCAFTPNSNSCDDADPCTWGDTCFAGNCLGESYSCDDHNPCTTDTCNGDGSCSNQPVADGTPCNDLNPCSYNDRCQSGACSGTLYSCNDSNPCTDDFCDGSGGCFHANNTSPCSDNNACTEGDVCSGGVCASGALVDCDDANPCTADSCHPLSGCLHDNITGPCNDGNLCTLDDACHNGACQGTPKNCSDTNVCTDDSCDPATGNCLHQNNTAACDDNDPCTVGDLCASGVCAGAPKDCDDGNVCTYDSCDAITGNCLHQNNTIPCSDGSLCTLNDQCLDGVCQGQAVVCNDNDICTDDSCNPQNGQCVFTPNTAACDDADPCTVSDTCSNGVCRGTPRDCSDGNVCTDDSCNRQTGECLHQNNTAACDDGNPCTVNDVCSAGVCSGVPRDCSDGNVCTDDSCSTQTGECLHQNNTAACDDGNRCTSGDICAAGTCRGVAVDCSSLDGPCSSGYCDTADGQCKVSTSPNGTSCDDENPCTIDDVCTSGVCAGINVDCDDGNVCTDDSCDPATGGCLHQANTAPCDDSDPCTVNDGCLQGACSGEQKDCSSLDGSCQVGRCNIENGECYAQTAPDGAACDDANACTQNDVCTGGVCAGTAVDCSSLDDACNSGVCDQTSGECKKQPRADGTACEDGDECTLGDKCQAGQCRPGAKDPTCAETGGGGCGCSTDGRVGWLPAGLMLALLTLRRKRA